jgi:hypothetical protein
MTQPQALGLVALVLAIAALSLGIAAQSAAKRAPKAAGSDLAGGIPALAAMAAEVAGDAVTADPLGALLGAGAIGFILESRPDLDHALVQQMLRQFIR